MPAAAGVSQGSPLGSPLGLLIYHMGLVVCYPFLLLAADLSPVLSYMSHVYECLFTPVVAAPCYLQHPMFGELNGHKQGVFTSTVWIGLLHAYTIGLHTSVQCLAEHCTEV